MRADYCEEIPGLYAVGGKNHDHELGDTGSDETADKSPTPDVDWGIGCGPAAGIVTKANLEREVNEDCESHVFLAESLVDELEVRDGIVGLEPNFGDKVDYDDALYVSKFEDAEHAFIHFEDAVPFLGLVFFLQEGEAEGNDQVAPTPEGEVAAQGHDAFSTRGGAEPAIGEVRRVKGKENGVGEEVAGSETHGLRGGSVGEVLRGEQCESPPVNSNVLCRAKEDQEEPPPGERPHSRSVTSPCGNHHFFDSSS